MQLMNLLMGCPSLSPNTPMVQWFSRLPIQMPTSDKTVQRRQFISRDVKSVLQIISRKQLERECILMALMFQHFLELTRMTGLRALN